MKALITISRTSNNEVRIELMDRNSRIRFVEMTLTLEDYANVITGLGAVEGDIKYRNLEDVGKQKVMEKRSMVLDTDNKDKIKKILLKNHEGDGWIVDTYLNSQKSVEYLSSGSYKINYSVYKYI